MQQDHILFRQKATERKENVQCTFLANVRVGAKASCHSFKEQDHILFRQKATERKENVQCTFLANVRVGAKASCHSFKEQDHILFRQKDDNLKHVLYSISCLLKSHVFLMLL